MFKTSVVGYPRIGEKRELKFLLENFWQGKIDEDEFILKYHELELSRCKLQSEFGIDLIPVGDMSMYDHVLDTAYMFGAIPKRFGKPNGLDLSVYFSMARGSKDAPAMEMTKWFDTNYHYLVPEIDDEQKFYLNYPFVLESFKRAKEAGIIAKPVILGGFTFLKLSKSYSPKRFKDLLLKLAPLYVELIQLLEKEGAKYVQIDEPYLVLGLTSDELKIFREFYYSILPYLSCKTILQTYFEGVPELEMLYELPFKGFGLDFCRSDENLNKILNTDFPENKFLVAGLINGRNIWKSDLTKVIKILDKIKVKVHPDKIILSTSCSLMFIPSSDKNAEDFPKELINRLSFAKDRLKELYTLKEFLNGNNLFSSKIEESHKIWEKTPETFFIKEVHNRIKNLKKEDFIRKEPFEERYNIQMDELKLGLFPTTTIGSFPQTKELRAKRAAFKSGSISKEEYTSYIKNLIEDAIKKQEDLGLDVFVHGEFERTDMVEFFGEKLQGFATSKFAWVQSYGSRCVRPPIIYADIMRNAPMTLDEIIYAQSLTKKPVKGMLTGPVTILNWSFVREDIPREEVAYQIALALADEILDLEKNGIKIIQIDEPAFREGLPLRKSNREKYIDWAIKSFRLTNSNVKKNTQIHTHMCYSEFNEMIEAIYAMDSDVISIEASRSKGDILEVFEKFKYDHGIGLGTYDIHSPRVPSVSEILEILERSIKVIDKKLIWVNPDCGLKTRNWEETIPSLKNMVEAAKIMRERNK
ncbi:methionine synthase (B12-independent) [Thermodesulfobium acidiphilum]|uniref:5-methyltetrahydropteroyltriglutamate--homocysteine methyltransferase n=1 Tax=Thermodesulfobium acidiphilum TaxID=1794699 RepID=A0A2R4W1U8_THEAF|nr:5-methyltetrahydropteroyltriglutamate--homocysteine S-methyltransferase [Thermodesulfobium acidiphilum]AWB10690.1 methionine synthase (B12-independent) [Thermodesulfobium acidiphilum]